MVKKIIIALLAFIAFFQTLNAAIADENTLDGHIPLLLNIYSVKNKYALIQFVLKVIMNSLFRILF